MSFRICGKSANSKGENSHIIQKLKIEDIFLQNCPICLDLVNIQAGILPCNHFFCFSCISKWSDETNKCPICNSRFKLIKKIEKGQAKESIINVNDKDQHNDGGIELDPQLIEEDFVARLQDALENGQPVPPPPRSQDFSFISHRSGDSDVQVFMHPTAEYLTNPLVESQCFEPVNHFSYCDELIVPHHRPSFFQFFRQHHGIDDEDDDDDDDDFEDDREKEELEFLMHFNSMEESEPLSDEEFDEHQNEMDIEQYSKEDGRDSHGTCQTELRNKKYEDFQRADDKCSAKTLKSSSIQRKRLRRDALIKRHMHLLKRRRLHRITNSINSVNPQSESLIGPKQLSTVHGQTSRTSLFNRFQSAKDKKHIRQRAKKSLPQVITICTLDDDHKTKEKSEASSSYSTQQLVDGSFEEFYCQNEKSHLNEDSDSKERINEVEVKPLFCDDAEESESIEDDYNKANEKNGTKIKDSVSKLEEDWGKSPSDSEFVLPQKAKRMRKRR